MQNNTQYPKKNSNTGLIIAVSILTVVIILGTLTAVLLLTGVLSFNQTEVETEALQTAAAAPSSAPTPEAVPAAADNSIKQIVYVANVNNSIYLRSTPEETEGNILTEIPLATPVGFIEQADAVFDKINYNGMIGYAKRQYLSATQPVVDNTVKQTMYVANVRESIYLRSTPAETDSNIITTIPLGTAVGYISSANNTFAKINYNGTIGYAKHIYLSNYPYSSNTYNTTMYVSNVKHSIYLRSAPVEDESNIIMEIPLGEAVTLIEYTNDTFYKINYRGTVGYAKAEYLSW